MLSNSKDAKFIFPQTEKGEKMRTLIRNSSLHNYWWIPNKDCLFPELFFSSRIDKFPEWFLKKPDERIFDDFSTEGLLNKAADARQISGSIWSNLTASADVLSYGVGILQDLSTPQSVFEAIMGLSPKKSLQSEYMTSFSVYSIPIKEELYYVRSTNILTGAQIGELEHVANSKEDLTAYCDYLRRLETVELERDGITYIERMHLLKGKYSGFDKAWLDHITYGFWDTLPTTSSQLKERAQHILDNTFIDTNPTFTGIYDHQDLWDELSRTKMEVSYKKEN